ncbi:sulfur oxidation c-type cytochrome SoxA [Alsobacter sp. SYSU M60028]|uniref:SoxAX cytochrome complex subunit A n=1 Tax=Alsobacter ponti TaxID=2962936 RepID=A0ABT1LHI2_9HYPH|nr:sulfur oxidation c-type cytochrome SoxA [Alsobacter ponti]MCP8940967.1 sulfur oxidation c-type cytochrome SoxA [Alsobacter ponti]
MRRTSRRPDAPPRAALARLLAVPALLTGLAAAVAVAAEASHEVEGRRSGWLYNSPETQALQDDEFINPGMFAVERGRTLWSTPEGSAGKSCASCHEEGSMRGVAARYPVYDEKRGGLVDLTTRVNLMRTELMGAPALGYEAADMLAMTAYLGRESLGMPMQVAVDGPARPFFEEGRAFYFARRGQLNLSCAQCHDDLAGRKLRGDTISQGQINGFPIYRLLWRAMGSRHRMFEWCNTSLRAEPYPAGSREYLSLELYVAWRGRGLPIETPAVRR